MEEVPMITGPDGIQSHATIFFLTFWFQRERCEALWSVVIVAHVFSSNGEVCHGEWHGSRHLRVGNGGLSPGDDEVLAWLVIRDLEQQHR
jgi:hypothetical protein